MVEINPQQEQAFETNFQESAEITFVSGEQGPSGPPGEFGLGYATILADAAIPPSGAVSVEISPNFFLEDGAAIQGTLEGVNGELRRNGAGYEFTRNNSGTSVPLTANKSVFVPLETERFLLVVQDLTELRNRPAPNTTINISVIGGESVQTFRWDSSSTETDNGESVIKPNALNNGESGRYILQGELQATGGAERLYKTIPEGNRIHVSPFGDDNNFGFIPENPLRSLEEAATVALLLQTNDPKRRDAGRMVQRNRNAIIDEAVAYLKQNFSNVCGNTRKSWRDLQLLFDLFLKDLVYSQDGDWSNQFVLQASAKLKEALSSQNQINAIQSLTTAILRPLITVAIDGTLSQSDFTLTNPSTVFTENAKEGDCGYILTNAQNIINDFRQDVTESAVISERIKQPDRKPYSTILLASTAQNSQNDELDYRVSRPLSIPDRVSIVGDSLRRVTIRPTLDVQKRSTGLFLRLNSPIDRLQTDSDTWLASNSEIGEGGLLRLKAIDNSKLTLSTGLTQDTEVDTISLSKSPAFDLRRGDVLYLKDGDQEGYVRVGAESSGANITIVPHKPQTDLSAGSEVWIAPRAEWLADLPGILKEEQERQAEAVTVESNTAIAGINLLLVGSAFYCTGVVFRDHANAAIAFRRDTPQIFASPYIQNCSSISTLGAAGVEINGFLPSAPDTGLPDTSGLTDAQRRKKQVTELRSMVLDAFTQINTYGGIGHIGRNNGYAQMVSTFTTFCDIGIFGESGFLVNLSNSVTDFGFWGFIANGLAENYYLEGVNAVETTGVPEGLPPQVAVYLRVIPDDSREAIKLNPDNPVFNSNSAYGEFFDDNGELDLSGLNSNRAKRERAKQLIQFNSTLVLADSYTDDQGNSVTVTLPRLVDKVVLAEDATAFAGDDLKDIKVVFRPSQRIPNGYSLAEGATLRFYLTTTITSSGHGFEYIGTGNNYKTALPESGGVPDQSKKYREAEGGQVFVSSTDVTGNFEVGDFFRVEQSSGQVQLSPSGLSLTNLTEFGPFISQGVQQDTVIRGLTNSSDLSESGFPRPDVLPTASAVDSFFGQNTAQVLADAEQALEVSLQNNFAIQRLENPIVDLAGWGFRHNVFFRGDFTVDLSSSDFSNESFTWNDRAANVETLKRIPSWVDEFNEYVNSEGLSIDQSGYNEFRDRAPFTVNFVIDTSASMAETGELWKIKQALISFAYGFQAEDSLVFYLFDSSTQLLRPNIFSYRQSPVFVAEQGQNRARDLIRLGLMKFIGAVFPDESDTTITDEKYITGGSLDLSNDSDREILEPKSILQLDNPQGEYKEQDIKIWNKQEVTGNSAADAVQAKAQFSVAQTTTIDGSPVLEFNEIIPDGLEGNTIQNNSNQDVAELKAYIDDTTARVEVINQARFNNLTNGATAFVTGYNLLTLQTAPADPELINRKALVLTGSEELGVIRSLYSNTELGIDPQNAQQQSALDSVSSGDPITFRYKDGWRNFSDYKNRLNPLPLTQEKLKTSLEVNFVLAIDASGSMGDEAEELNAGIRSFADQLRANGINVYFALIYFYANILIYNFETGQYDSNPTSFEANFTQNVDALKTQLDFGLTPNDRPSAIQTGPENSVGTLEYVGNQIPYRENAQKNLLLASDETPQSTSVNPTTQEKQNALDALTSSNLDLLHFFVNPSFDEEWDFWQYPINEAPQSGKLPGVRAEIANPDFSGASSLFQVANEITQESDLVAKPNITTRKGILPPGYTTYQRGFGVPAVLASPGVGTSGALTNGIVASGQTALYESVAVAVNDLLDPKESLTLRNTRNPLPRNPLRNGTINVIGVCTDGTDNDSFLNQIPDYQFEATTFTTALTGTPALMTGSYTQTVSFTFTTTNGTTLAITYTPDTDTVSELYQGIGQAILNNDLLLEDGWSAKVVNQKLVIQTSGKGSVDTIPSNFIPIEKESTNRAAQVNKLFDSVFVDRQSKIVNVSIATVSPNTTYSLSIQRLDGKAESVSYTTQAEDNKANLYQKLANRVNANQALVDSGWKAIDSTKLILRNEQSSNVFVSSSSLDVKGITNFVTLDTTKGLQFIPVRQVYTQEILKFYRAYQNALANPGEWSDLPSVYIDEQGDLNNATDDLGFVVPRFSSPATALNSPSFPNFLLENNLDDPNNGIPNYYVFQSVSNQPGVLSAVYGPVIPITISGVTDQQDKEFVDVIGNQITEQSAVQNLKNTQIDNLAFEMFSQLGYLYTLTKSIYSSGRIGYVLLDPGYEKTGNLTKANSLLARDLKNYRGLYFIASAYSPSVLKASVKNRSQFSINPEASVAEQKEALFNSFNSSIQTIGVPVVKREDLRPAHPEVFPKTPFSQDTWLRDTFLGINLGDIKALPYNSPDASLDYKWQRYQNNTYRFLITIDQTQATYSNDLITLKETKSDDSSGFRVSASLESTASGLLDRLFSLIQPNLDETKEIEKLSDNGNTTGLLIQSDSPVLANPYKNAILDDLPFSLWGLEQDSTTTKYPSETGRITLSENGTVNDPQPSLTRFGFSGSSAGGYLTAETSQDTDNIITEDFSVEFWIESTNLSSGTIFSNGSSGISIEVDNASNIVVNTNTTLSTAIFSTDDSLIGAHIVYVHNSFTGQELWLNGSRVDFSDVTSPLQASGTPLHIFASPGGSNVLSLVALDEIALYNYPLDETQIQRHIGLVSDNPYEGIQRFSFYFERYNTSSNDKKIKAIATTQRREDLANNLRLKRQRNTGAV